LGLLVLAAAGCNRLPHIAPATLPPLPADSVRAWVAGLTPSAPLHYSLRWRFRNQKGSAGGRAAVRVAPPDTLRFDYRGPFGKAGSALLVHDSAIWSEPPDDVNQMIPAVPLFWAAIAHPMPPAPDDTIFGIATATQRVWRYANGTTVIDFVEELGSTPRLRAELRRNGRIVGQTDVRLDSTATRPLEATMAFPADASQFAFTVEAIDTVAAFDSTTWHPK
jgi:hypothetical protein